MAASQFIWNADGSASVIVNGRKIGLAPGAVAPGQVITVAGVKVTVPPQTSQAAPALTPIEQRDVNADMNALLNQEIDNNLQLTLARTNNDRTVVDIASAALRATMNAEENAAARGQYSSGLRDAALIDVERQKILQTDRANQDLTAAENYAAAKQGAINAAKANIGNYAATQAALNMSPGGALYAPPAPANLMPAPGVKQPASASPGAGGPLPAPKVKTAAKAPAITSGQKQMLGGSAYAPLGKKK